MEHVADSAKPGLRDRKKARRRDEIIAAARELFTVQGIDATTMAEIAAAAEVSAPTVFNYFGSKDGILIAMISEGTRTAREQDKGLHWREGADLVALIVDLFLRVSSRTLDVAGKRVWRYAEAAAIRHPETNLSQEYRNVSNALLVRVVLLAQFEPLIGLIFTDACVARPRRRGQRQDNRTERTGNAI